MFILANYTKMKGNASRWLSTGMITEILTLPCQTNRIKIYQQPCQRIMHPFLYVIISVYIKKRVSKILFQRN